MGILVVLGNNMFFTYFISFFVLWIPITLIEKFIFHSNFDTILITTIFITGAATVIAMEGNLKQIKIIAKNAFRKK